MSWLDYLFPRHAWDALSEKNLGVYCAKNITEFLGYLIPNGLTWFLTHRLLNMKDSDSPHSTSWIDKAQSQLSSCLKVFFIEDLANAFSRLLPIHGFVFKNVISKFFRYPLLRAFLGSLLTDRIGLNKILSSILYRPAYNFLAPICSTFMSKEFMHRLSDNLKYLNFSSTGAPEDCGLFSNILASLKNAYDNSFAWLLNINLAGHSNIDNNAQWLGTHSAALLEKLGQFLSLRNTATDYMQDGLTAIGDFCDNIYPYGIHPCYYLSVTIAALAAYNYDKLLLLTKKEEKNIIHNNNVITVVR